MLELAFVLNGEKGVSDEKGKWDGGDDLKNGVS